VKRFNGGRLGRSPAVSTLKLTLALFLLSSCATTPPPRVVSLPRPVIAHTAPSPWPRAEVLSLARKAYACGAREGQFDRPVLTVIDYSLPASEPRLWVIDMQSNRLLKRELVAHGEGSGSRMAVSFSNDPGSHQSSLGLFRTEGTYTGRYGYALRLAGLEPDINDRALERAIVLHGSPDVGPSAIARWGTIGLSWGCPMVSQDAAPEIIDSIAGGSAIFAYYPDTEWLQQSRYLHCDQVAGADRPR
jgi:hypothetical protein